MKKNAFTLIELSIVLVIIGLIIGGSFKVLKSMRENAKITNAKNDVQTAKNAVIGNTILNRNTLPNQAFFHKNLSPVKNNQHPLLYANAPELELETKNICASITTSLTVKKYKWNAAKTNEEEDKIILDVAFVIASESQNNNMQTAKIGNIVKYHAPFFKVDDNTSPRNIIENYDDIVDWVTLSELQKSVGCEKRPLRIVNSSLPRTSTLDSNNYKAQIIIDGNYTQPTDSNCSFSFPFASPVDNNFSYDKPTFMITNSGSAKSTTVTVDCNVGADGKVASKKFVITVN